MDVDLVIFDKDGTLIDIHYYWGGMIKLRSEMLSKKYIKVSAQKKVTKELMSIMGINLATGKIRSTGPIGINPREFIIALVSKTMEQHYSAITPEQVSDVFIEIDIYSQKHLERLVKPLPGVENLLMRLKRQQIKIAIATTDLTSRAKLAMDSIGLSQYFDYIAGSDLVDKAKPSPDLVDYLCKKLSSNKNKTVVVGDSIVDFRMAKLAGVGFIGVKTGLYSPEFLKGSKNLVENLENIEGVL
jgi:phosphoglycolate phosphatase